MRLSIIIATHNSYGSLSKTLDSILSQNYKDYEVIIVDGASTDGTVRLIKAYEKKFKGKLRWVSEKDKGIYEAMNKGIDMSAGEWIYFLGSDDTLCDNNVLGSVSTAINEKDFDIVYGNVQWGDSDKIYDGKFSTLKIMQKNICHQAIFFKKDIFKRIGKFDTKYKTSADYVFNMKWFNDKSVTHRYIDVTVAKYNIEGHSSGKLDPNFWPERDAIIKKYFPAYILILRGFYKSFRNIFKRVFKGRDKSDAKS